MVEERGIYSNRPNFNSKTFLFMVFFTARFIVYFKLFDRRYDIHEVALLYVELSLLMQRSNLIFNE